MIIFDHLTDDDLRAAAVSLGLPEWTFDASRLAYLAARVDDSPGPAACWPWVGPRNGSGYGVACAGGTTCSAHRLIHVLVNGPLASPKLLVRHDCDQPHCCRPDHLRAGTHHDNMADKAARGRARGRVLDPDDIEFLPILLARTARSHLRRTGTRMTRTELFATYSREFGVSPGRIGSVYDQARRAASVSADREPAT